MAGIILLVLGSLKIYLWVNERLMSRQQYYESTRVAAGSASAGSPPVWDDTPSRLRLDVFSTD